MCHKALYVRVQQVKFPKLNMNAEAVYIFIYTNLHVTMHILDLLVYYICECTSFIKLKPSCLNGEKELIYNNYLVG